MKKLKLSITLISITLSTSVNAHLQSRLGGLAYYDDEADLTWLANANAGAGSVFDDESFIERSTATDGKMSWQSASDWSAGLTVNGVGGWRLPRTLQVDTSCITPSGLPSSGAALGVNCIGSELGNLFYNVLGGSAFNSITTTNNTNYDLFNNVQAGLYWSETGIPTTDLVFTFNMLDGNQTVNFKPFTGGIYAWAVQSGDISTVPVPASIWLFGSGLIGLIGLARRKA